jgi:hypothetical protein
MSAVSQFVVRNSLAQEQGRQAGLQAVIMFYICQSGSEMARRRPAVLRTSLTVTAFNVTVQ